MNRTHYSLSSLAQPLRGISFSKLRVQILAYLTVQKLLIIASLALVLLFDIFHIYTDPTSLAPVGSIGFEIGRFLTALFLFFLLITDPPRSFVFRVALGVSAFIIFALAGYSFFTYQLGFIDSVLYTEVAIILGLEALEAQSRPTTSHGRQDVTRVRVS